MYPKRVCCIDVSGFAANHLTLGQVYTATGENLRASSDYILDLPPSSMCSWNKSRFEDVVAAEEITSFQVEYIDNLHSEILIVGSIYTVVHQTDKYYYLKGLSYFNGIWYGGIKKKRFVRLDQPLLDNPTVAVNNHICPSCKNDRCSKSEKSCWKCGGVL